MPSEHDFKIHVARTAQKAMVAIMGTASGKRAGARVALAFAEAASRARDPMALYKCSGESIAACIATACETGLMPGGPYPKAYLVPRGGQLNFEITHRGIAVVAQRAGCALRAIPVRADEDVTISFGEVTEHDANPDAYPTDLNDLRGIYVSMTRLKDGANMGRPWVPVSVIKLRAESRQAGPVWKQWPIEMAQKTAIKYCVARGMLVIDSDDLDIAMSAEPVYDTSVVMAPATTDEAPALPDHGDDPDGLDRFAQDREKAAQREKVETKTEEAPAAPQAAPTPEVDRGALKARIDELRPQLSDDSRIRINDEYGVPSDVGPWRAGPAKIQSAISAMEASIGGPVDTMQADADAANSQRSMDY